MFVQFVDLCYGSMLRMVAPYLRMDNSVQTNNNQGKCLKTVIGYRISVYYIYIDSSLHFLCSVLGLVTTEKKKKDAQSPLKKSLSMMKGSTEVKEKHCSHISYSFISLQ